MFSQCFNYANFTGLVHLPAILLYAKKCARFKSQASFTEILSK
jgi:argonaute-like protein implicated in RNA metabolism and viral defense